MGWWWGKCFPLLVFWERSISKIVWAEHVTSFPTWIRTIKTGEQRLTIILYLCHPTSLNYDGRKSKTELECIAQQWGRGRVSWSPSGDYFWGRWLSRKCPRETWILILFWKLMYIKVHPTLLKRHCFFPPWKSQEFHQHTIPLFTT